MKLTSLGEVIKYKIHNFPTVSFVHNCKKILHLYKSWAPSHPVAPNNICGPSVWTLLHDTLLAPALLRWYLDFLKVFVLLSV